MPIKLDSNNEAPPVTPGTNAHELLAGTRKKFDPTNVRGTQSCQGVPFIIRRRKRQRPGYRIFLRDVCGYP